MIITSGKGDLEFFSLMAEVRRKKISNVFEMISLVIIAAEADPRTLNNHTKLNQEAQGACVHLLRLAIDGKLTCGTPNVQDGVRLEEMIELVAEGVDHGVGNLLNLNGDPVSMDLRSCGKEYELLAIYAEGCLRIEGIIRIPRDVHERFWKFLGEDDASSWGISRVLSGELQSDADSGFDLF